MHTWSLRENRKGRLSRITGVLELVASRLEGSHVLSRRFTSAPILHYDYIARA